MWLLQAHSNGRDTLTKDQIIRWAGTQLHIAMEDGAGGFSKWSNATRMEAKGWVQRTAYSRWVRLLELRTRCVIPFGEQVYRQGGSTCIADLGGSSFMHMHMLFQRRG
jgi:hypothetical protein